MTMQEPSHPKRFYDAVSLGMADGQFSVLLDGRGAKTPARNPLTAPSKTLAEVIVSEWSAQGPHIVFRSMPMTGYQMTVLDASPAEHQAWRAEINRFLASDLLCYRAEGPVALVERQATCWDTHLAILAARFDIALKATAGVIYVDQDPAVLARAATLIAGLERADLLVARRLTELTGSAALGLLGAHGAASDGAIIEAAQLDEVFQAEKWGQDSEAIERRQQIAREISDAVRFRQLVSETA
ncbi:MAG: ATP12 family protein [Pseudomonadota bacterium]